MGEKDTALVVTGGDEPVWLRVGSCPTQNLHHFYESTDFTLAERPSSVTRASEPVSDRLRVRAGLGLVTVNRDLLKSTEKTSWRDFLPHPEEKNLEFEGEYLQKFVFI